MSEALRRVEAAAEREVADGRAPGPGSQTAESGRRKADGGRRTAEGGPQEVEATDDE